MPGLLDKFFGRTSRRKQAATQAALAQQEQANALAQAQQAGPAKLAKQITIYKPTMVSITPSPGGPPMTMSAAHPTNVAKVVITGGLQIGTIKGWAVRTPFWIGVQSSDGTWVRHDSVDFVRVLGGSTSRLDARVTSEAVRDVHRAIVGDMVARIGVARAFDILGEAIWDVYE